MKKLGIIILSVVMVGLLGSAGAAVAANRTKEAKVCELGQSEVFTGLYIRAADTVNIAGTVNGDVIVAANTVTISGVVRGNVYAAGESVVISGTVSGNVHLAASKATVSGKTGSLYVAASDVTTAPSAQADGSIMAAASSILLEGTSSQAAYLAGSTVIVDGAVGGSLNVAGATIGLESKAKVGGDFTYDSSSVPQISNDQNISGTVRKANPAASSPSKSWWSTKLMGLLYSVASALLLGMVLLKLIPGTMQASADYLAKRPARSLLVGLGFILLAPITLVLLFVTVVGIPVAILGLFAYIAVWMVASQLPALWLGRMVTRKDSSGMKFSDNALALLIGLLVLSLVGLLPGLGGLVGLLVLMGGSGALVARNWQRLRHVGQAQAKA